MSNFMYHLNMLGFNVVMLLLSVIFVAAVIMAYHLGKILYHDFQDEMRKYDEAQEWKRQWEEHNKELREKRNERR